MSCLKLTYYQSEPQLKIVYRKTEPQEKAVQRWLSACPPERKRRRIDPLSDKYPSMSPFMYCAGNPVVLVDPDGAREKLLVRVF